MDDWPTPPKPAQRPPTDTGHIVARSLGGTAGCLGGLGALAAFIMPWFIFVAVVQVGCRAPLQVQFYQVTGATLALQQSPGMSQHLAQATLIAMVGVGIAALSGVIRPTPRRALLLVALAVVGAALVGSLGALAASGQITLTIFTSAYYLGFGSGWWIALGALALALAGGAALHAAARPVWPRGGPVGEMALAALGMAGLFASLVGMVAVPLAPYPSLSCAPPAAGSAPVGHGVIYSAAPAGVDALDAASGAVLWRCRNPLGGIVTVGPPALADGMLIVESRDGFVYSIRASDASILWRRDVGGHGLYVNQTPNAAPIVVDGVIYGVNAGGALFALRASDGARVWSPAASPPAARLNPLLTVVGGQLLYVANASGEAHLTALDAKSGQTLWQSPGALFESGYPPQAAPTLVAGGMVYGEERQPTTGVISVVARSLADGSQRWSATLSAPGQTAQSVPFIARGVVYVETLAMAEANATGAPNPLTWKVVALRASDGARLWSVAPGGKLAYLSDLAGVAWATDDTRVYLAVARSGSFGDSAGESVYAFASEGGRLVWRHDTTPIGSTVTPTHVVTLAATGTSLYLLDYAKTLSAFDAGSGAMRWQANEATPPPFPYPGQSGATSLTLVPGGDALYVAGYQLTAVDMGSGVRRWQFTPDGVTTPYSGPFWAPVVAPPAFGG